MQANSGRVMPHRWFGKLAVDMKGLSIGKQRKAVLRDHDGSKIAGWSRNISKNDKAGLVAEIEITDVTPSGDEALKLYDAGFPWEASVYVPPQEVQGAVEIVPEGAEAEVNGQKLKGPGAIIRKSRLRELTLTAVGVDEKTSVSALSAAGGDLTFKLTDVEEIPMADVKTTPPEGSISKEELEAKLGEVRKAAILEGGQAAATDERKRCGDILSEAIKHGLADQAPALLEAGLSSVDAISKLKDIRLEKLEKAAASSPGPNADDAASLSALPPAERWEKDAKLREGWSCKENFLAYTKADGEGKIRTLKRADK